MGRPRKHPLTQQNGHKVDESTPIAVSEVDIVQEKIILDQMDSEKKKRDVQIRTIENYEKEIESVSAKFQGLCAEYNVKNRINENLGASIASAQANLAAFDRIFADKNAKRLGDLDRKQKELEEADKEIQALIGTNKAKEKALDIERGLFESERVKNRGLLHAAETALAQNNSIWKSREKDILEREAKLKQEQAEFETYKESLAPELARITSIKNENNLLLQKIEVQRLENERIRMEVNRAKETSEKDMAVMRAKAASDNQRIANEDARLRKWEQDMKDTQLEIAARTAELNKDLRRQKLTEIAKGAA